MKFFIIIFILAIHSYSSQVSASRQTRQPHNIRFCGDVFNEKRNRVLERFNWGQLQQVRVAVPTAQAYTGHGGRVEMHGGSCNSTKKL